MSSATARWFDLAEFNAKVERHDSDGFGHYKLRLEVSRDRIEPAIPPGGEQDPALALLDLGWDTEKSSDDRVSLVNHAPLNRKSEIVAALRPFFSEEEIEASHVPVHSLQQGEVVEGLQARQIITQEELAQDIDGVDPSDFDRISSSVRKAQELQAERRKKQTAVLFDGAGRKLFNHLTDEIMRQKDVGEDAAALFSLSALEDAARTPHSVHAARMTDLARCVADGQLEQAEAGVSYVIGRVGVSDEDWQDASDELSLNPRMEELRSSLSHMEYGPLVSVRDAALNGSRALTPFVMDARPVEGAVEQACEIYRERIPFMVIRDSSVPSKMLAQSMSAVDAALDVVAAELELPRDGLMSRQRDVPVRFSFDAVSTDASVQGMVKGIASDGDDSEEERGAVMMNLSVSKGRTFIHELGHLMDVGNDLSEQERHEILSKSGMLDLARQAVDKEFPEGGDYAEYLLDEAEVFARSFDAHFVNVSRFNGDPDLSSIGGFHTTHGFDRAAPFGDLEKSASFIAALKDTLALRREAKHEARQSSSAENVAEAAAPASFQMQ